MAVTDLTLSIRVLGWSQMGDGMDRRSTRRNHHMAALDEAFDLGILDSAIRVLKAAAPAPVPPGATGSKEAPVPPQKAGTFNPVTWGHRVIGIAQAVVEQRMEVSRCAFCRKSYTLVEFQLLRLVGYFGTNENGGIRVELRDCGCGNDNTIGRVL
jgi:hypothetical protein